MSKLHPSLVRQATRKQLADKNVRAPVVAALPRCLHQAFPFL
jgi:hypothetical protein